MATACTAEWNEMEVWIVAPEGVEFLPGQDYTDHFVSHTGKRVGHVVETLEVLPTAVKVRLAFRGDTLPWGLGGGTP